MERILKIVRSPEDLNNNWDNLAHCYFQKREFLNHLHKFNPCNQRYYELYCNGALMAGTIVYTLRLNLLTFSGIPSPFKVQVIGLPVSVAAVPVIGDPGEFGYLLNELLKQESGIILGINFTEDYLKGKVLNLRTLPTVILNLQSHSTDDYEKSLRHPYRRRLRRIREKFSAVSFRSTECAEFTGEHYLLYLQIMKHTTTKLETLSPEAFKYLPSNFILTTFYSGDTMICWHIVCRDNGILFFYFGGMNYRYRDQFSAYNNNLFEILTYALSNNYTVIDFGQTAEIAKTRLGGQLSERRMFLFHKNSIVQGILRLFSPLINYSETHEKPHVFRPVSSIIHQR